MACDTWVRKNQTLTERKAEVKSVREKLEKLLVAGQVIAKVGPQGAVVFSAWADSERAGVTDACAFRMIMQSGSVAAKLKLQQAQQMAGRTVSRQVIGQGVHSHDGGKTWHNGH